MVQFGNIGGWNLICSFYILNYFTTIYTEAKLDPEMSRMVFETLMNDMINQTLHQNYNHNYRMFKTYYNEDANSAPETHVAMKSLQRPNFTRAPKLIKNNIPLEPDTLGQIDFPVPKLAERDPDVWPDPKMTKNIQNKLMKWIWEHRRMHKKKFHSIDQPPDFNDQTVILSRPKTFNETEQPWKELLDVLE